MNKRRIFSIIAAVVLSMNIFICSKNHVKAAYDTYTSSDGTKVI